MDTIDTSFEKLDDRFAWLDGDYVVEILDRGSRKSEGPAYFAAGRYLVWSDIPNSRLMRWDETTGAVGVLREDSGYANGNTIDREGRLVTCEQGNRRVTRTEHDGTVTVLADRYDGKRLNSPNDVVVRADGTIWFTDPSYGIDERLRGERRHERARRLFRVPPRPEHRRRSPSSPTTSSDPTAWPSPATSPSCSSSTPARTPATSGSSTSATTGR